MKQIPRMKKKLLTRINLKQAATHYYTDDRRFCQIPLWVIIQQLFFIPFNVCRSMLALDESNRTQSTKKQFGCCRKMVFSDSTLQRILKWLRVWESRLFVLHVLRQTMNEGVLERRILRKSLHKRRIGIIDGTHMSGHYISSLTLSGEINFPALWRTYSKGSELAASHKLLAAAGGTPGENQPDLFLMDSLYFNKKIFDRVVRDMGKNLVIKSRDPEFREVLRDADLCVRHLPEECERFNGYDCERLRRYSIYETYGEFAGYPLKIIKVFEHLSKKDEDREYFVVTTDLELSAQELRECAFIRWQIENNVFKRLNELCGTKNCRSHDENSFLNYLLLISAGMAMFDWILIQLKRDKPVWKYILNGRKSTWKNCLSAFRQMFMVSLRFIW